MKPIRMCINCRNRLYQKDMYRFVCNNKQIELFKGIGRSFYICNSCKEDLNLWKKFIPVCKVDKNKAKEITNNVKEKMFNEIKN